MRGFSSRKEAEDSYPRRVAMTSNVARAAAAARVPAVRTRVSLSGTPVRPNAPTYSKRNHRPGLTVMWPTSGETADGQ